MASTSWTPKNIDAPSLFVQFSALSLIPSAIRHSARSTGILVTRFISLRSFLDSHQQPIRLRDVRFIQFRIRPEGTREWMQGHTDTCLPWTVPCMRPAPPDIWRDTLALCTVAKSISPACGRRVSAACPRPTSSTCSPKQVRRPQSRAISSMAPGRHCGSRPCRRGHRQGSVAEGMHANRHWERVAAALWRVSSWVPGRCTSCTGWKFP